MLFPSFLIFPTFSHSFSLFLSFHSFTGIHAAEYVHGCFLSTNGNTYWNEASLGGTSGYRYCLSASSSCDKCERGKYKIQPTSDDTICTDMSTNTCPQGQEYHSNSSPSSDGLGSTANDGRCESCPAGRYKSVVNSNCIQMTTSACPPGQGFSSASTTAASMTESSANDGTCTLCPIHKYKTSTGYTTCKDMTTGRFCPAGEIFSSASATSGVIGSTQNDGTCDACPVNTWKGTTTTDVSSNVCTTCHDHSVTDGLDQRTSIDDCHCFKGYYATSGGELGTPSCDVCPLKTYKTTVSSSDNCLSCPSGSSTVTTANTKPEDCLCDKGHGGCVFSVVCFFILY